MSHQAVLGAASPEGRMKPINVAAQLAAAETELACLKLVLTQIRQDCDGLRRERDLGAGRPKSFATTPRSSERLMSGASIPQNAARGGVGSRAEAGSLARGPRHRQAAPPARPRRELQRRDTAA